MDVAAERVAHSIVAVHSLLVARWVEKRAAVACMHVALSRVVRPQLFFRERRTHWATNLRQLGIHPVKVSLTY